MRTNGLSVLSFVLLASMAASCASSEARGSDALQLGVAHINADWYPDAPDRGAIGSWMILTYLGNGVDAHIGPNPSDAIYNYGRSLQPTGAFHEDTLRNILNHFEIDPDYEYAVVHDVDFGGLVRQIAVSLNRNIPDVAPYPVNAPALIAFQGSYDRWVVVTGIVADEDPSEHPDTTVRGVWVDDPAIYNDPMFPSETNIFFSTEPGVPTNLQTYLLPMGEGQYAGEYVAVLPVPSAFINLDPVAVASVQQLTDLWLFATVRLDGSASSDPDQAADTLTYRWTIDSSVTCDGTFATCAVTTVPLSLGTHVVTLRVTDPLGASNEVTQYITLDPAALSVLEIDRARVQFGSPFSEVTLRGQLGLPLGVNFSELETRATVQATLADISVLPTTAVTLAASGGDGKHWKFDATGATPGVRKLYIDWKGASYAFRDPEFPLEFASDLITTTETTLDIKHKISPRRPLVGPFDVSIGGLARVSFDGTGKVTFCDVPYEVEGKRVSLRLPFPLTDETVINVMGSLSRQINVAEDLKASVGRYRLEARFSAALLPNGAATLPRTAALNVTIGAQEYPGTAIVECEMHQTNEHRWSHNDCSDQ